MRPLTSPLFIAAFVLLLPACELAGPSRIDEERTDLRDSVRQAYYEDARQLAVRAMAEEDDPPVEIPDERVQPFYEALLAVYNAHDSFARDSILGIHALPRYSLHEVNVGVDKAVEWTEAWRNGQRLTGHEPVDTLVTRYDLTLDRYFDFGDEGAAATLRSEDPINPVGLSAAFEGISGIRYAESNRLVGDGGDIWAEVLDNGIRLHFSRAWGDCPAGCIHRTTWTFRVGADGTVTFEGRSSN